MKMMDMGHTMPKTEGVSPTVSKEGKDRKVYPTLYLDHKVPDDMMSKDVGAMCRLEIIGKIVSKSIDDTSQGARNNMRIEVHKMGYKAQAGKLTKDEYLEKSDEEREDYDKEQADIEEEEE